jgi:hypothetical protein
MRAAAIVVVAFSACTDTGTPAGVLLPRTDVRLDDLQRAELTDAGPEKEYSALWRLPACDIDVQLRWWGRCVSRAPIVTAGEPVEAVRDGKPWLVTAMEVSLPRARRNRQVEARMIDQTSERHDAVVAQNWVAAGLSCRHDPAHPFDRADLDLTQVQLRGDGSYLPPGTLGNPWQRARDER